MHFIFSLNLSSVAHEISSVEDPNVGKFKEGPPRKINSTKFQTFCQRGVGGGRPKVEFFLWVPLSILLWRCQVVVAHVAGWLGLCMYTLSQSQILSRLHRTHCTLYCLCVHCAVCTTRIRLYRYRLYTLLYCMHAHCTQQTARVSDSWIQICGQLEGNNIVLYLKHSVEV